MVNEPVFQIDMSAGKGDDSLDQIQRNVWDARLPLEIRLTESESRSFNQSEAYLVSLDIEVLMYMLMSIDICSSIIVFALLVKKIAGLFCR